jgi:hypothetical protein
MRFRISFNTTAPANAFNGSRQELPDNQSASDKVKAETLESGFSARSRNISGQCLYIN